MTDDATVIPDEGGSGDGLTSCPRCSMKVRRSELEIHLAHAHNIGRDTRKDKKRSRPRSD